MTGRTILTATEVRFLNTQRVGYLATANASGNPHVIPVCFAFDGSRFFIALDEKPKRVPDAELTRVRNIQQRGEVSLVIDQYTEDWTRLGYLLVHGQAALLPPQTHDHIEAIALLRERYPQYRAMDLQDRQVIAVTSTGVTSWGTAQTDQPAQPDADSSAGRGLDFLPLARARRSVRQYQGRPVDRSLLEHLIEAARWAPSPHGRQPWRFVVLTSSASKAQLAQAMGDAWQRNLDMDGQPANVVATRLRRSHERIIQAPALIIPCLYLATLDRYPDPQRQVAEETMAVQSLGAAVQNLLLAAHAMGLDTGWMCAPLFCTDVVRDALALDSALIPHALITVGYAAQDPIRRPRLPLEQLIVRLD
ncbi:MAG TPA: TIGR03668 family PPOX class F420-dependent oxidoreductase [Ktedonobacterales bacterium]|nr:TIGR03668 family PPOX class F420-dependent oxidoreductase [Ktedonobacterales bacterium]